MKHVERVVVTEMRVPFRDIDMDGRMRASAYIDHAEAALASFWRCRPAIEDEPLFLTTKTACRIADALKPDDLVRMTVNVDKIGGKFVGFTIAMERGNVIAAEVELMRTATDRDASDPVAIPEDIRDWLYQYLD
ncbi:acyl-CoA thioesterase [Rhizobium halophytocola]|uniref:Acyl-CoA thioester hydrolase n=1 Tax=Rhizobium halophytocola TaxID=735519 RepID=A0ABS4DXC8_9HYPH|nr:thioesterase family protein [Rhizobium halophytocola]MBP1850346.1 acyl-CoA thioester hydrolase [Rhizobium halophytocola]